MSIRPRGLMRMTAEPNNPLSLSGARARKLRFLSWHFASTATSPSQGRRACLKTQQRDSAGLLLPPCPSFRFPREAPGLAPRNPRTDEKGRPPSREGETCGLVASFKEEGVSFLSEVPQGRKSRFPRLICCLGLPTCRHKSNDRREGQTCGLAVNLKEIVFPFF